MAHLNIFCKVLYNFKCNPQDITQITRKYGTKAMDSTTPTQQFYDAFETAYSHFNTRLFFNELPPVIFTITRKLKCMGYFSPERWTSNAGENCHEIAINPTYIANNTLIEVLQTLAHEAVHCWQTSSGKPSRNGYHNKEWAEKMESIGLMPSDTGQPEGKKTGQNMSDYPIQEGAFLEACRALLKDKQFSLPWLDRQAKPAIQKPIPNWLENSNEEGSSEFELLLTTMAELLPGVVLEEEPQVYNTKTKYTCEGCQLNVWGKTNLNLSCDDCDTKLEPQGV
jgi:predicted SprT family Zn-dependent metalloprotease